MGLSFSELNYNSVETLPGYEISAAFTVNSATIFREDIDIVPTIVANPFSYFEDYIGGHGLEEFLELDTLYNEWVSLQPKHIKKELELGIYRVRAYPKSDDSIGCFTKTAKENRIKQDDGKIRIEEWEEVSVPEIG